MKKRLIVVLLCACIVCSLFPAVNAYTNNHTSADAVAWANSQIGIGLDYDGYYGNQCVDLIMYYYAYLGCAGYANGNAIDYASNSLPAGWTRVYGNYQPGDIAVWQANHSCNTCSTGSLGHVGIITSVGAYTFEAVNQNFNDQAYCSKNTFNTSALLCAIRPDFNGGSTTTTMTWTEEVCNPTETDAYISIKAVPSVSGTFGECGITIKDADTGAVVGSKTETADPTARTHLTIYYNVTGELGVVLKPGKSYTYQFYTYFNGTRYDSPIGRFTTPHTHTYAAVITAPTCTEQGFTTHTCSICGDSYVDSYVSALGHEFGAWTQTKAPTCTEKGEEKRSCSRCAAFEIRVTDALGHDLVHHDAKAATCTEIGWNAYDTCSRCNYTTYAEIPALQHSFVNGVCTVCGEKDPDYKPSNPFVDVKDGDYYCDPVLWAVAHDPQITNGVDATHFAPNDTCTRGQVVTFLWRAKGEPEPKSTENPFTDIKESDYFYKAVLWAKENGITTGTTDTTFSPNAGCTRAQVVTFLWRTEGQPLPTGSKNPFKDVTGDYYYVAVLWAVDKGITKGTSDTTFSPNDTCTRGQIVTFLYRDLG